MTAPLVGDPGDQPPALLGGLHADDPAVGGVAPAVDEPALLHPVHDAGHARLADVHGLGEAAHRERPSASRIYITCRWTSAGARRASGACTATPPGCLRGQLGQEVLRQALRFR